MIPFNVDHFTNEMITYTPEPIQCAFAYEYVDHIPVGIYTQVNMYEKNLLLECYLSFEEINAQKRKGSVESLFAEAYYAQLQKIATQLKD